MWDFMHKTVCGMKTPKSVSPPRHTPRDADTSGIADSSTTPSTESVSDDEEEDEDDGMCIVVQKIKKLSFQNVVKFKCEPGKHKP